MANWNLSVDLRGHGNDLAQSLKSAAKNARSLGSAARAAKTEVRELGQASQSASRHIRTLGSAAQTAQRHINRLGDQAATTARRLNRYGDAARTANRNLTSLGDHSRTAGRDLARMSGQIDTAIRDLTRLAAAARTADARLNRVGGAGVTGVRRYREEASRLSSTMRSMAGLGATLGLALGFHEVLKEGNQYQQAMNAFGATTHATQMQMQRAAAVANQLGSDLHLPGATAADAAEAMVELAKAGFRTDQAISATRASLVLASAAQVSAADSAKYLGDMMDQFGMGADQAGRAADILAATANAASGEIIDIYYAMKYAGPVAHGLGVNMEDAAAAVGMLGKAGILGQTAGTTLRGMFANLAAPTKQMKEGLADLGIEAWDTQGRFKGLRTVIDGLSEAQHNMTQQDFAAAVKKAFGKPAMSGAIAMAHQGVESFDAMRQTLKGVGAATDIAAAKGKRLAGAMLQLKTQARQTGLTIYQGMAPGLEFLTRGLTAGLAAATPKIKSFFDYLNDASTLFGPDLAAAARREFGGIADAVEGMAGPLKSLGGDALANFLHILINVGKAALDVLHNTVDAVEPVVGAFSDLSSQSSVASSAMNTVVYVLDLATSAVSALSSVLVPIGHVVATLVHAFGALPGPIQQFVIAAMLTSRIQPRMAALASTVSGRVTGAFRGLGEQMALQRSLAASAGQSLSRYGAAMAVLQARIPVFGRMGESFRSAAAAGSGFTGTLRGIGAASLTATRALGSGLLGALGGPWGLAITAATVGLGLLAQKQQEAAQAAAEHESRIRDLAQALRESKGQIDDNVRTTAAQSLQDLKLADGKTQLIDVTKRAGIGLRQLTDAYLGQGDSLSTLRKQLEAVAEQHTKYVAIGKDSTRKTYDEQGKAAKQAAEAIGSMSGDMEKAVTKAKDLANATRDTGDGTSAYSRLKDAVGALADKTADADSRTRALREALDLLSGGSVSLQAAQARVNEAITQANEAFASGVDKADGWGKALVNASGAIDTTTKNGQSLFNTLTTIADGSASAATAAYDFAESQGKDLPTRMKAATSEMQKARDAAVKLGQQYGLSKQQAEGVADAMGLIPSQVSILLSTKGVDSTLAELLAIQAGFQQVPNQKTIKVDALGEEAKRELEELGYKIELIPGTREYKITAPTADARAQLDLLVQSMSKVPGGKNVKVNVDKAVAVAGLDQVIAKIRATPGAKSVTVKTLNATAIHALEAVGFKVTHLPNGQVSVTAHTGTAIGNIKAVQSARDALSDKSITVTVTKRTVFETIGSAPSTTADLLRKQADALGKADGGIVDYYATGGLRGKRRTPGDLANQHTAQIAPAGSYRVWGESETEGEGYVPFRRSARPRSRAITEEIVRRLGGDPSGIHWYAQGGVTAFADGGFSYTPSGTVRSVSDVQSAYSDAHQPIEKEDYDKALRARANAVDTLRSAEAKLAQVRRHRHTHAQLVAAETAVAKARRSLATATDRAKNAEARYKKQFSLSDWQRTLASTVAANASYEASLKRIAARGGADVIDQLRDMGAEGAAMIAALAKASNSQFNAIVANLRKLAPAAKATLADYTSQLNAATKTSSTFQANLAKLAAMGYGDLATQLAAQGDESAQKIAADAVKSTKDADKANAAAKANANTLSQEQLGELVQIIASISSSKTGIHDVAAKTGLEEDEIIAVATKARAQISSSLGARATKFLADLTRAGQHLSYADGGLRAGIYATQAGIIRFAEPETQGEAYLPLGANKRRTALPVLADVAKRFGLGLTNAAATRPVVIVKEAGDTHVTVTAVRTSATASDIGAQVGRSVRRARRGGVAARAA